MGGRSEAKKVGRLLGHVGSGEPGLRWDLGRRPAARMALLRLRPQRRGTAVQPAGATYQVIPDAVPQDVELHEAQLPVAVPLGSR